MLEINGTVLLIGDIHGEVPTLRWIAKTRHISDCSIILLGDTGLGFGNVKQDYLYSNKIWEKRDIHLYLIRGNHDDPSFWLDKEKREAFNKENSHVTLLEDQIIKINGFDYLVLGGATSIDKRYRKVNKTWWPDEHMDYTTEYLSPDTKVTGILSHVGPVPLSAQPLGDHWFENASTLKQDLAFEKQFINNVIDIIKPSKWFYGHYHITESFNVGEGTACRVLDIFELLELKP